ncbi:MAG: hypothetical protein M3O09_00980 [Acidobacteriota bacterium]|nr:hypothetical protein [Acidobacteriota bacterium]
MPRTFYKLLSSAVAFIACTIIPCHNAVAQTKSDGRVVVESFTILGTRAIDSEKLAELTGSMSGSTFNDDAEELKERIRAQFQDRGYFKAEVAKLEIKVLDPLASPKPVRLEAQVSEGPLCSLSNIEFTGNHAFTSQDLRARFPIKSGSEFARSKVVAGLERIRDIYTSRGFLEAVFIPDANLDSSSTAKLNVEVREGLQYRMDKLEIFGPAEIAEKLQMRWELPTGAPYDASYTTTFLEKNNSLLPEGFSPINGVGVFLDCRDALVSVHLHLTQDPQHGWSETRRLCAGGRERRVAWREMITTTMKGVTRRSGIPILDENRPLPGAVRGPVAGDCS